MGQLSVVKEIYSVARNRRNPLIWRHIRSGRRLRQSDFNVRPLMNLFMILVPFLLMYTSFVEISILHSAISQEGGAAVSETVKLGLILEVHDKGYRLKSRTYELKRFFERGEKAFGAGQYEVNAGDFPRLSQLLRQLKQTFPEEVEVTLIPTRQNSYQEVIQLMDVVREYRDQDRIKPLFPNIAFMAAAKGAS